MAFRRGQVWVETVVYTLIGLSLMGLVLAILTPQIKESRDKTLIDQTIDSLNLIDSKINEVLDAPGNKRKVEFGMKKGELYINAPNDYIEFVLDPSESMYSEPGVALELGRVEVTTTELTKDYRVAIKVQYAYDIQFNGDDTVDKKFGATSVPYNFFVENKGIVTNVQVIDITEG